MISDKRNETKTISCKDMIMGNVGVITNTDTNHKGTIIIKTFGSHYISLGNIDNLSGHAGKDTWQSSSDPNFQVELVDWDITIRSKSNP